jgi:hypothetical protein
LTEHPDEFERNQTLEVGMLLEERDEFGLVVLSEFAHIAQVSNRDVCT